MRPLAVVIFAIIVIGGLYAYLRIAEGPIEASEFFETEAEGVFSLELTIPFDAEANAFSSDVALLVQLDGRVLKRETNPVAAGFYKIDQIEGIKVGRNEFLVEIQPKSTGFQPSPDFALEQDDQAKPAPLALPVAVRLQVFRDEILLDEFTVWNQPGLPLIASFLIEVDAVQFGEDE